MLALPNALYIIQNGNLQPLYFERVIAQSKTLAGQEKIRLVIQGTFAHSCTACLNVFPG